MLALLGVRHIFHVSGLRVNCTGVNLLRKQLRVSAPVYHDQSVIVRVANALLHSFTCSRFNISYCSHVVTVDVLNECYLTNLYGSISLIRE